MVPRPTNGPRALGPITTRSAQGIATTGRYAANQGAAKVISPYDDPYAYQDSSPLQEPVPVRTPVRTTPARDPNADDGSAYAPANVDKEAMLSPETQQQVIDAVKGAVVGRVKDAALQGGTVSTAATLAGLPSNVSIGAGLATGANALTSLSPMGLAIGYGLPAFNEYVPQAYAKIRDYFDPDSYTYGRNLDQYRDEDGQINFDEVRADQRTRTAISIGNELERSRPLHEQFADFASPVTGWLNDNVARPTMGLLGFDEEPEMTPEARMARDEINDALGYAASHAAVSEEMRDMSLGRPAESIAETAMDEAGRSPDFAQSDYSYNPQMSREQNLEAMAQQERQDREQAEADAQSRAEIEGRRSVGGVDVDKKGVGAGFGSYGHLSSGRSGGLNNRDNKGNMARGDRQRDVSGDRGSGNTGAGGNGGRGGAGNNY
ncbi:hypothetical protein V6C53_15170 [Desulfocurvibacter africanus]|uniref:hypothetical protein n=1 Tax=Desulfocurvibacter africanus TaxID=873 RepID=UPI002FD92CF0